jgi:hypothetical protein
MPTSSGVRTRASRTDAQGPVAHTSAQAGSVRSEPSAAYHPGDYPIPLGDDPARGPRSLVEPVPPIPPPSLPEGVSPNGALEPMPLPPVPEPSPEDPEFGLAAVVRKLVIQVQDVQQALTASIAREIKMKGELESVRNVVTDLEEIVMRQLVSDLPEEPETSVKKNKIQNKSASATKGGVHNRRKAREVSDDESSLDGDTSEDSEEEAVNYAAGSSDPPLGRRIPGLIEIQARRPEFRPLLNYRTYRLRNSRQVVTEKDTLRVNSLLKRMRHHMEYRYSGMPALKVIDFLSTFKEAMDVMRVSEGLAALLLPHALDGDARSGVQSLWKQGIGKTPKYPTAVNWLLESYATETVIDQTTKDVLTASQAPGETEDAFASRLRRNATEAGNVFTEDTLISVYLAGLHPYAANTVRGQVTPTMKFAAVRNLAIQAGTAGRARASGRDPVPGLIPARSRPQVATIAESTPSSSYGGETYPMMGGVTPIAALEPSSYANSHIDSYSSESEVSIPTRGWPSIAGSVVDDATFAITPQRRGCYLCFRTDHFVMDCPFLSPEIKVAIQQQRDAELRPGAGSRFPVGIPVARTTVSPPTAPSAHPNPQFVTSQTKPPFTPARWEVNPRVGRPQLLRRPPTAAVHHVDAPGAPVDHSASVAPQSSENARGDA